LAPPLGNLIAFSLGGEGHGDSWLRLVDRKLINALQHLEKQQCIAVGKITSQYPLFVRILPQTGALMDESRES
jgi:hypothetical protein